ncbi:MAG: N-acetylneuraminate synthase family protein, partial [Candidatus Omnitrophica bacterium]|nr:N-acetylneuraminate synthase family protein [Candidatus Omnitrophota bacterium]
SDHTLGIEAAIAAAAMGACIIEKHFTMDRSMPGPDHQASLEPEELKAMVSAVRHVQEALGDGIKRPTAVELKNLGAIRRSIVAKRAIVKGELFSEDNLAVKRPARGLTPMRWHEVIGQKAKRNFKENEMVAL